MNTTHDNQNGGSSRRHHTDTQGIDLGNLVADSMRIGPAPTRAREAAVVVVSLILFGLVVAVLQPGVVVGAAAAAVVVAVMAVRWAVGTRKWVR